MQRQPNRRDVRPRPDHVSQVRARSNPPGGAIERIMGPLPIDDLPVPTRPSNNPYEVLAWSAQIAAAQTTRVSLAGFFPNTVVRLVHFSIFLDTNSTELVEIYTGLASSIEDGASDPKLRLRRPFSTAHSAWVRNWGVGLGPPSPPGSGWSIRRNSAPAGQILYFEVWYTLEWANG